jgi:hypothetical protein
MSGVFVFRQPPQGFITEYFGGGGKGGTSTSTVSIPPEVLARYNAVNARAEETAKQPFQQYGGEFVAPINEQQRAGMQGVNALAGKNVGPLTQEQIGYYQNPAMLATLAPTQAALQQQQGQQLAQQQAEAIKAGAWGGSGASNQRQLLRGQQQLGMGQALAPIYQQAYQTGLQTAGQQQGVVAQDLARQMQTAQAQMAAGQVGQQTQQAADTAKYQQFLQERGYPFQISQFLANIAMGTGALSGSTTTTQQPGGFFSDKRLKEDVKEIGETNDGQPIYSYKYKGDDRTQIGLMAQDVEKKHPEAVGLMGGYKTVDYKKATEGAERPHKDMGGGLMPNNFDASSMGGAVTSGMAGEGFERGGYVGGGLVGGDDWAQIIAANKAALGVYGGAQPMGGSPGATGIVPAASIPTPKLVTASAPSQQRPAGLSSAMQTGKDIASTYKMGKEGLIGSAKTAADPEGSAGFWGGQGKMDGQNIFSKGKDFLKETFAANGGLIVPRHAYADGGGDDSQGEEAVPYDPSDVMGGKDPMEGVLKAGSQKHEMLKPSGTGGGGGGSSPFSSILGGIGAAKGVMEAGSWLGSTALPFLAGLSDARVKDNIRPVGKTFDGQNIYSYNIGEGPTQMGLMAQEVLDRKPEAVGQRAGLLTVDYDRATEDAQPYASGGLVPRQGYDEGGPADTGSLFSSIEKKYELPEGYLNRTWQIESGGGKNLYNEGSKAAGHFQFIPGTQKMMGLQNPYDLSESADATARLAAQNREYLRKGGVEEPTAAHLYLAHQQGPLGATRLLNAADRPAGLVVGEKAVTGNRGDPNARGLDFANQIMAKYEGTQGPGSGPIPAAIPRPPGLVGEGMERTSSNGEGKKSLGDTLTSEGFVVPALGFLGSMLASNRPNLGQALGEGIMGGVGAYQSQQKQSAEMAKGVFDLIKTRFTRGTDEAGNTVFFDTVTGQKVPASMVQATGAAMLKDRGVNPTSYGFGASTQNAGFSVPEAPKAPEAPKTPNVGEKSQQKTEKEWMSKPPDQINLYDKSEGQLIEYAKTPQGSEHLGLSDPDRNPAKLQADIDKRKSWAQNVIRTGDREQVPAAQEALKLALEEQKRLDSYLKEAVGLQYAQNQELAKSSTQSAAKYEEQISVRSEQLPRVRKDLVRLADIFANYESGRPAETKAALESWFQGTIGYVPNVLKGQTVNYDEALKTALKEAFASVGENNLSRAPKAALQEAILTVPNPSSDPGAAYALIGRTLGEMDFINQRDQDYLSSGRGTRPVQFLTQYAKEKGNLVDKFTADVFNGPNAIPVGKGVSQSQRESLGRTYGFTPKPYAETNRSLPRTEQTREAVPAVVVEPGSRVGEEKQFKQGTGVWDGSKWVPKGQQ